MSEMPDPPSVEALVQDLRALCRTRRQSLSNLDLPALTRLSLVRTEAQTDEPTDLAQAARNLVAETVNVTFTPASLSWAAIRAVLGLGEARGRNLADRRDMAADVYGCTRATWIRHEEPDLLRSLAEAIRAAEREAVVHVHVRQSTAGGSRRESSLRRRSDEARLFALGYDYRAEVFHTLDLVDRLPAPPAEEIQAAAIAALEKFTAFAEARAHFTTRYDQGFVMAGNEVTAREAAQFLAIRPPFSDQDIGFLRLAVAQARENGQPLADAMLARDRVRANRILKVWWDALEISVGLSLTLPGQRNAKT